MNTRSFRISCVMVAAVAALALSSCAAEAGIEGTWGDPQTKDKPSLEFTSEGEYSGTDGCNQVGGQFMTDDDGTIDLGIMRSTTMFCEGVDDWLVFARTAELSGNKLVFHDESGAEVGTLTRADS